METKICSKCGEEKELSEFVKDKHCKYGVSRQCKMCANESDRKSYLNNPEKAKEASKRYYLNNPEYSKQYRISNPEKVKEAKKRYRIKNQEKLNETNKRYYLNNPEKAFYRRVRNRLKEQIGGEPPKELVEIKSLIIKTKKLCKTSKNLEIA